MTFVENLSTKVTSVAIANSLGVNPEEVCSKLFDAALTTSSSYLSSSEDLLLDRSCLVGALNSELPTLPVEYAALDSRFSKIIYLLYLQIQDKIESLKSEFGPDRIAVLLGSSTSGVDATEQPFVVREKKGSFPSSYTFFNQELGAGSSLLAGLAGVTGPAFTISTACSSGAKVFSTARTMLRRGVCDAVILGGVDSLCKMTIRGFSSLDLVSEEKSNPMSVNRRGLNIGEGGALFTMVRGSEGVLLLGVGESSDAYHISSPDPEGIGASTAMEKALADSDSTANDVAYLNLHGTGTLFNDAMESKAVARVLGDRVLCSSTKPLTGHLLGASGACEAAICYFMLEKSGSSLRVPLHCWDGQADPDLPKLNLVPPESSFKIQDNQVVLSNSFAFGGSNCCLAFGRR